jgi:hypothetical protein
MIALTMWDNGKRIPYFIGFFMGIGGHGSAAPLGSVQQDGEGREC